jgi:hypothetical protein
MCASPAAAQMAPTPPPHIQTLDVRMMSAAVVAIGQVVDYQLNAERKWDVRISVSEVLKGRAGSLLTVELAPSETRRRTTVATQTILAAWTQSAATLLLAVTPNQKGAPMVVELTDPELAVMTADLELLRTPEAVIAAAKAIIQQVPGVAPPPTFGLAVELRRVVDTPLDTRSGYSMSSNFLFADVPVDARLEARARGRIVARTAYQRGAGSRSVQISREHHAAASAAGRRGLAGYVRGVGWRPPAAADSVQRHPSRGVRRAAAHGRRRERARDVAAAGA